MIREELLALAREVAQRAHCPYSHFRVGVAVLAEGKTYVGVNVEISSYGLTLCAERSAWAAAISNGAGTITQTSGTVTGTTSAAFTSGSGVIGSLNITTPNWTANTTGNVTLVDSQATTGNGISNKRASSVKSGKCCWCRTDGTALV